MELKWFWFRSVKDLVEYINRVHIKREDIQEILTGSGVFYLLYWAQ